MCSGYLSDRKRPEYGVPMRSAKRTLVRIQRIAERVERRQSLQRVLDAMETRRMSAKDRLQLVERIAKDCMAGVITQAEANKMTKIVNMD